MTSIVQPSKTTSHFGATVALILIWWRRHGFFFFFKSVPILQLLLHTICLNSLCLIYIFICYLYYLFILSGRLSDIRSVHGWTLVQNLAWTRLSNIIKALTNCYCFGSIREYILAIHVDTIDHALAIIDQKLHLSSQSDHNYTVEVLIEYWVFDS